MPTINLLTWNLNNRAAALEALVKHIVSRSRRGESFIVVVQEGLDDCVAIQAQVQDGGGTVEVVGNGPMSVLCSQPLNPVGDSRGTVGGRLVLTRATFAGQRIAIVNYHGLAQQQRGSPDPTERGGIASEARWRIDNHARNDPVIILGDFNVEPHGSEIRSRYCFSLAPEPNPESHRSHNRERQHLRVALPRFPPNVEGTYRLESGTEGTLWKTLDLIAASAGLYVQAKVLNKLNREPLSDGLTPNKSDHLPVAGTLEL